MKNTKVLELLNTGKIEELKQALADEIYAESIKSKSGAKKRYSAMKKYFGYHGSAREILQRPCEIEFEGKSYISFCNSYSLALTTESCGEINMVEDPSRYPDVARLVHFDGRGKEIDISKVIAEAKSNGYKLNKKEVGLGFKYLMKYDETYYKIGLLEATYGIIDDGEIPLVYKSDKSNRPMTIRNDIGIAMIMPVRMDTGPEVEHVVIEVD